MRRCVLLIALLVAAIPGARAASWEIQDESRIGFTAYQKGQPVEGSFETFEAEVELDPDQPEQGRITVEIAVDSITTGHKDRDGALRSSSFFNAEKWPTARFESDAITPAGKGAYEAKGKLTIRDVTEEVVLPFTLETSEEPARLRARAEGELTISRLAYGVGQGDFASTGTVGDEVDIHVLIEATRPR